MSFTTPPHLHLSYNSFQNRIIGQISKYETLPNSGQFSPKGVEGVVMDYIYINFIEKR
jgi:hypothetical protein